MTFKLCEAHFGPDGMEHTATISEFHTLEEAVAAGRELVEQYPHLDLVVHVPEDQRGEEEYPGEKEWVDVF